MELILQSPMQTIFCWKVKNQKKNVFEVSGFRSVDTSWRKKNANFSLVNKIFVTKWHETWSSMNKCHKRYACSWKCLLPTKFPGFVKLLQYICVKHALFVSFVKTLNGFGRRCARRHLKKLKECYRQTCFWHITIQKQKIEASFASSYGIGACIMHKL